MLDEELTSQIIDKEAYKTEIAKKYTMFLAQYPEIFSDLISGSIFDFALYDSAEEYYERYHNIMAHPQPGIELDSKVNKPRLKLWQIGYKHWQKDFNF